MTISVIFEAFNRLSAPLSKMKNELNTFGKAVSRAQNCMFKMNQTAELMGRMGDTIGQLARPGLEFEQSMADLSSITGITGKELAKLGEVARKTGKDSGMGAAGAANAFGLLASQIDVSKIGMDGLVELQNKTITLSQASGMSMEEAANSMAGTINQFGLQASEAGRVINVLAAGSKYGAAEIPQLAESFKVVGAACNAAGLSVESTAGAIEVLSKNNLKGAEAGTALRNIVLKMQTAMGVDFSKTSLQEALVKLKPHMKDATYMSKLFGMENVAAAQFLVANSDMVKEMTDRVTDTNVAQEQAATRTSTWSYEMEIQAARFNDWGISLQQTCPGILNMIQLTGQAGNMFMTLGPVGKLLMGVGKGALGAGTGMIRFVKITRMLALAKSTRSAEVFARVVGKCGVMGRVAAGMLKGYNAVLFACRSALTKAFWAQTRHAAALKLHAAWMWLSTKSIAAGNAVTAIWSSVTSKAFWIELQKTTATKLHTAWTWLSTKAMLVAGIATSGWSKVTKAAAFIQGGLTKALRVCRTVMISGVLPALGGVIAATWAWTAALLANPITWIVLTVGALVAAIIACWQNFAGFRAVILTVWDTVCGFGKAVWDFVVAPFKAAWEFLKGIGNAIATLWGGGSFEEAGGDIAKGFSNGVDAGIDSLKDAANGVVNTATGIGGNYEMHLTEERAKQGQKEKEKAEEKQQKETPDIYMPDIRIPEVDTPEMEESGMGTPPVSEMPAPVINVPRMDVPLVHVPEIDISGANTDTTGFVIPPAPEPEMTTVNVTRMEAPPVHVPEIDMSGTPEANAGPTGFVMPPVPDVDINTPTLPVSNPVNNINVTSADIRPADMDIPEVKDGSPDGNFDMPSVPEVTGYSAENTPKISQMPQNVNRITDNLTNNNQKAVTNNNQTVPVKIDISFQPVINVSAEMTQKSKDDMLAIFRRFGSELTRIIEENQRKEGRAAYGTVS